MRKYFHYFDIVLCSLLIGFFGWHIFNGKLGWLASRKYKNQLLQLQEKQASQLQLQKRLKSDIAAIGERINKDYLETQALKHWYKVPKGSKIIKL